MIIAGKAASGTGACSLLWALESLDCRGGRGVQKEIGKALGGRLKTLRLAHGLTLQALSSRLEDQGVEVSEATLHRAEKGTCMLRLDTARAVFNYLGVSLGYVDEIIAEAQIREEVDLTNRSFEDLMDEGRENGEYGDYQRAVQLFHAAQERLALEAETAGDRLGEALLCEADCQKRLRRFRLA
ncbi:MAG TPA: XRE family transcriptional regulator, partial [Acidobacteria bacterium]|nr:XRE family transcriptional regulator [Acidobacteriota bacterium]